MSVMVATVRYTPSTPQKKRPASQSVSDSTDVSGSEVTVSSPRAPKRARISKSFSPE